MWQQWATIWRVGLSAGWLGLGGTAGAAVPAGLAEYLVPFDEDVLVYVTDPITSASIAPNETVYSLVAVTGWTDNITLYYDHWEDGYEILDTNNPSVGADESYTLSLGQTLQFLSTAVPRPRTGGDGNTYVGAAGDCVGQAAPASPLTRTTPNYCYDGRDRIVTVGGGVTVTRASWPNNPGVVAAAAEEVYPLKPQLLHYVLPFGEDAVVNDFNRVFVVIQATADNTSLQIDLDGNGTFDSFDQANGYRTARDGGVDGNTLILNRGQTYILSNDSDGNAGTLLPKGATVLASDTVQVQYFFGQSNSTHNTRSVSAYPQGFWDDAYYAPASTQAANPADLVLYNPEATAITINWQGTTASGTFTLDPGETARFSAKTGANLTEGSGLFLSGSAKFWGFSNVDSNSELYDWSYTLVPAYLVSDDQFVAWAPGSETPASDPDANGLFLIATQDNTTFFIDKDADGLPDTGFAVSVAGVSRAAVNAGYPADRLETLYITDTDGDLSGVHIWATAPFAMAYGENPRTAPAEAPGVDLGYTTLPNPSEWVDLALTVSKATNPVAVALTGPQTVTYTLTLNTHAFDVTGVRVLDTLAAGWHYTAGPNTTLITFPNGTTSPAHPVVTATGAPLPAPFAGNCPAGGGACLTWDGSVLGNMAADQQLTLQLTATIADPVAAGYASGALSQNQVTALATRTVGSETQTFQVSDFVFNTYTNNTVSMTVDKHSNAPNPLSPGDRFTYSITVANPGTSSIDLTDVGVFDALPAGLSEVPGSGAVASCNRAPDNVRDDFGLVAYSNNDGSASWNGNWIESDTGLGGASSGLIAVTAGELIFQGSAGGPQTVRDEFNSISYNNNNGTETWRNNWVETDQGNRSATAGFVRVANDSGALPTNELIFLGASGSYNVRDQFGTSDYGNNDGSLGWVNNWTETDPAGGGASAGAVRVTGGQLLLEGSAEGIKALERTVNLTGATGTTLTFAYNTTGLEPDDQLQVVVEGVVIATFTGSSIPAGCVGTVSSGTCSLAVSSTASAVPVRFQTVNGTFTSSDDQFFIDDVQVGFTLSNAVGNSILRRANLSGATAASLTFVCEPQNLETSDDLVIEVRAGNSGAFTSLATLDSACTGTQTFDLTAYIGADTQIQYRVASNFNATDEAMRLDDVQIAYTLAGTATHSIRRDVDLTQAATATLTFRVNRVNVEAGDQMDVLFGPTGAPAVIASFNGTTLPAGCILEGGVGPYAQCTFAGLGVGGNRRLVFDVVSGYDAADEQFILDEVDIGLTHVPLTTISHAPEFIPASLGCVLTPGSSMVLTFEVIVEAGFTQITNEACAVADELPMAICDTVTHRILNPTTDTATVGDKVWLDDGDGVLEIGEAGIANVAVTLKDRFGTPLQVVTTDGQGRYLFTGVAFDFAYYVEVTGGLPAGLVQTTDGRIDNRTNSFDLYDSVTDLGNSRDNFDTAAYSNSDGSVAWGSNWTEVEEGTISPVNGDVRVEAGELRLNNGDGGNENSLRRTLSVPAGANQATLSFAYRTTGVEADDAITLEISTNGGSAYQVLQVFTGLTGTASGNFSLDISPYLTPTNTLVRFRTGNTYTAGDDRYFVDNLAISYRQASGVQAYLNADLGYRPATGTAVIGDRVWSDPDADGVQDAGEPGFSGVTVWIYSDLDEDGAVDDTRNILAGRIDLNASGAVDGADDGIFAGYAVLDGRLDINRDGAITTADDGLVSGMAVIDGELDTNSSGGVDGTDDRSSVPGYLETTSAADGSYLFGVTSSGGTGGPDYIVVLPTLPTGYQLTTQASFVIANVADGAAYRTADFGLDQMASGNTYDIRDRVWRDINNDGDQDGGEPGIAGVTVDLLNASGTVIATTATDGAGLFSFTGVATGVRYRWRISDTGGVLRNFFGTTAPAQAGEFQMPDTLDEADDVADGVNDDAVTYSDPGGPVGYRPNFGFNSARTIGDTVFNDLDGDAVQDVGEAGINGVTVLLYRDVDNDNVFEPGGNDGAALASTPTDSNGVYLFSGLDDGRYWVSIDPAQTTLNGYTVRTTPDDEGGTGDQREVSLTAVGTACTDAASAAMDCLGADYGYRTVTAFTLSGVIWNDNGVGGGLANDGVNDPIGEPGIGGVTLALLQAGIVIRTTVTAVDGSYSFTGLPAGVAPNAYVVRVTDTDGTLSGNTTTYEKTEGALAGGYDGQEMVAVPLGGNITDLNFGYVSQAAATYALITNLTASADPADGRVVVQWETLLESGTAGFYLERRDSGSGQYQRLHNELLTAVLISPLGGYYAFADNGVKAGETHQYRLIELEADGDRLTHGPYRVTVKAINPVSAASDTAASNGVAISALASEAKRSGYARQAKALGRSRTRADGTDLPTSISLPTPAVGGLTAVTQAKLPVTQTGLHYVSAATLAEYLGTSVDQMKANLGAGQLSLSMGNSPVAYTVAAGNAGLYFVGERYENRYTAQNTYWVTRNQTGNRMDVVTGPAPAAASGGSYLDQRTAETNTYLIPYAPRDANADIWFWGYVNVGGTSPSGPYTLTVDAPGATGTGTATLTLHLQGASNLAPGNDHHAEIWVNGTKVGDAQWDGQAAYVAQASFSGNLLRSTTNQIQVSGALETGVTQSSFLIDKLELGYQRNYQAVNDSLLLRGDGNAVITVTGFTGADIAVFELANPAQPVRIEAVKVEMAGGSYQASFNPRSPTADYLVTRLAVASQPQPVTEFGSDLKASDNSADYLIITPAALQPGAEALASYRSARFQTQVVTLEDIYDEFNAGRADAAAIRDFLTTVQSWQRRPQYVVLIGKGTLDPRNYLGLGTNRLPVLLAATSDGLYQADGRYGDLQGDGVPEYAIGRIPALTHAEVQAYVNKLKAFESSNPPAAKALLVADNADSAGNFPQDSTALATLLAGINVTTVHHDAASAAATTRQNILTALNAGVGVFNYLGHGAPTQFADEGLLRSSDVASLNNSRLPIFGAFSCYLGYGALPGLNSLADELTLKSSGGVIASLAPTGLSRNDYAATLSQIFIPALVAGQTVGVAANTALASGTVPVEVRTIYNLLGDPALVAH